MTTRVTGALVAVLGLLVVLGGILLGSIGVSTGGFVQRVDCGTYFSPDYTEARDKDNALTSLSWRDLLRGERPQPSTEAREACDAELAQRRVPVLAALGIGTVIVAVGLGVGLFPVAATALAKREEDSAAREQDSGPAAGTGPGGG
ncbi:hypothetical protein O4162_09670 [Dietzia maris]|uniref:hypothetical protein n=1 Tax=Dietzia maris TaxID=37915 RepID=UPI0022B492BE|nr:hypothetical protein [Dietzia maris]MBB0990542.1 hypothetical protein [Dietzia sp. SLG510A3-30A2]MCZ4540416.1 hypothetical protein [Dietzia maris]